MAMKLKRPLSPDGDDGGSDDGSRASSSRHTLNGNGHGNGHNGTANGNGKAEKHAHARKQRRTFANAPGAALASPSSSSPSSAGAAAPPSDPRMVEARNRLPIATARQALVDAIKGNETVIVLADTGSGKSTRE